MIRRTVNATLATVGLLLSLPVLIILIVAIRLETKGNPVFAQRRLGRGEKEFTCYKLRTMFAGTPEVASHLSSKSQVTRVGNLMRKTKLDELPQLWNVLIGDMDLIGPRPGLPNQTQLTGARRKEGVFAARPGITGLAQVSGVDMSTPDKLAKLDRIYLENRSLKADLKIGWATLTGAGYGDRTS